MFSIHIVTFDVGMVLDKPDLITPILRNQKHSFLRIVMFLVESHYISH